MQPVVIESNELTSQSKIYFSDVLPIILLTHPMFFGVYGNMDHILNGADHRLLKKAHGIGAARDRGGSLKNLFSISYWPCQSALLWVNIFRHLMWPFTKYPRICIFPSPSDPRVMTPDIR
jgi:hypothetical protein